MIPLTWLIGCVPCVSEYSLTLPSECPEYTIGYTVLQLTVLTALPH